MKQEGQRALLDELYAAYNRRSLVSPDPLEKLYPYSDIRDRELVGLIAASLAFGGVPVILKSIDDVLTPMTGAPCAFLASTPPRELRRIYARFQHRWVDGPMLAGLLEAIAAVVRDFGSLESAFESRRAGDAPTRLTGFVARLKERAPIDIRPLLPDPAAGSACKRLHLYLRWMVRQDDVDPGGWAALTPSELMIPLDVHMHRIACDMKLTNRRQANGRTAREVTDGFRRLCPDDPVRYDFVLTRFGIRRNQDRSVFIERYNSV